MPSDTTSHQSMLINLAGEAACKRGAKYFSEGRVSRLATRAGTTTATVTGSQPYKVRLRETARGYDGSCTCPASEGFDFCKHCVAVALALQAHDDRVRELADAGPEARLRQYLADQPRESLIQLLLMAADDHAELHERLVLKADAAHGQLSAGQLKKMMTSALPLRRVVEWRKVAEYFARATAAVDSLASVADDVQPKDLLAAVVHAIARLQKVLERIDDSDANRWRLQQSLRDLHINALTRLDWPPAKRAAHVLDMIVQDETDMFAEAPGTYEAVLGEDGKAAFHAEVYKRLEALPDLPFGADFEDKYPYLRLSSLLRGKLEDEGDIAGKIALAKRTCTSAIDCRRIAQLYLELPDLEQAQVWLTRAEGAPGHRQVEYATRVALHRAREDWPAALEAQRRLLENQPGIGALQILEELAQRAGKLDEVRTAVKTLLRQRIDNHARDRSACAETLAYMLGSEGDEAAANALLLHRVDNEEALMQRARELVKSDPETSQALAARAIDVCVKRGAGSGYRDATALLPQAAKVCDSIGDGAYSKLLRGLRQRHKARRPFLALLAKAERAGRT